jgi:RNA polymerase sigma-70 factor (ECF subfamily)
MSGIEAAPERAEARAHPQNGAAGAVDHDRVAELFAAHNRQLLRFLTCRLRSAHEAKEIAQEAYVRMLELDRPSGIGYLRAYLFKTAANLAADRLKSSKRRERIDRLEFFDETQDFAPSPEGGIAAEQELATLLQLLEELPARCRYAFVMHRFQGHSVAEIAKLMNVTTRTVQLYVERVVEYCEERLQRREHDDEQAS